MMTTTHSQVLYFETLTAQHPVPARPNPVGITTDNCAISCCDLVLLRCPVQVTVRVTGWARTAAHIKVRRGRSSTDAVNPIDVRWEISIDERERYITTLPIALLDGENEDPHARKRRPAQFAEPEQEPNKDGSNPEGGNESSE